MVKQHTDKLMINLGHNNPPVNPKSIDFTNSAIEKLKLDNLDFGNKRFLFIPFNVPRGSHLKGLKLTVVKATKVKKFTLVYWLGGRSNEYNLGAYRPYRNSNDLGFTCIQVNKKQYDIYNEHTNDKGIYLTSPKVAGKIKDTKITDHQLEVLDSLTLRCLLYTSPSPRD